MERFALIPLAGGVVLLVTWIAAPAAPRSTGADDRVLDAPPVTAQVDQEVRRLRDRLATTIDYPAPVRNPFRFVPRRPSPREAAPVIDTAPAEIAEPILPVLVGITTPPGDDRQRSAIVKVGAEEIRIVKKGDRFGDLVVETVESAALVLVSPTTSRTYRIALH